MLYIFLNPKKKINNLILKMIETHEITFKVFYPQNKDELLGYDIKDSENSIALSILSKVIFPKSFLSNFKNSYNIHPGTKNYPGFGYNFALLNNEIEYGAVCHHMEEEIDSGDIILESNFLIHETESVDTLQFKTYLHILIIFNDFIDNYISKKLDNLKRVQWSRKPYLKEEFIQMAEKIEDDNLKEKFTRYPDKETPLVERYF